MMEIVFVLIGTHINSTIYYNPLYPDIWKAQRTGRRPCIYRLKSFTAKMIFLNALLWNSVTIYSKDFINIYAAHYLFLIHMRF